LAIAIFITTVTAQEAKPVAIEKAKKESCCAAKFTNDKAMTAENAEQRQIKGKAQGKKCRNKKA
jgi:hypothetical protein